MAQNPLKVLTGLDLNGALTIASSSGTSGQVLLSAGSGATPTWGTFTGITASSYVAVGVLAADQALTVSGTDTPVSFVDYVDPQNWWNPSTKRFTPNIAGYYNITFQTLWTSLNSTNQTNTQIRKNGNSETIQQRSPDANNPYFMSASKVIYMNGSTDYLEFTAWSPVTTQSLSQGNAAGSGTNFSAQLTTSGANIVSNALTIGTTGLTATSGSSPWSGSAAATIDIDTTKVPLLSSANTFTAGPQTIQTGADANKGLVVKGNSANQSGNIFEVQTSASGILASIGNTGTLSLNGRMVVGGSLSARVDVAAGATQIGVGVKASASQTADLIQLQNSSSTILGGQNANGQIYTGAAPIVGTVGGTIQSIATGANPLVTMASAHGLSAGDLVTLAGTTGGTYNGTFAITSPSGSTFNIVSALTTGQAAAGGTATVPAQASITARDAGTKGLVVKAAASQVQNLQEWQDSAGATLSRVNSSGSFAIAGNLVVGSTSITGTNQAQIISTNATNKGLVIQGAASQSSNLQEWQDSTSAVQALVSSTGAVVSKQLIATTTTSAGASTFTFSSIPQTYRNLEIVYTLTTANFSSSAITVTYNGVTTANYQYAISNGVNSTGTGSTLNASYGSNQTGIVLPSMITTSGSFSMTIENYTSATAPKLGAYKGIVSATTAGTYFGAIGFNGTNAAVTSVTFTVAGTTTGQVIVANLYGVN